MDNKLVGWARAVKSRSRHGERRGVPPLWLFTDPARMGDVAGAVSRLPKGLCGVVVRHDGVGGRAKMIQAVWQVCRNRRLAMVVAGVGAIPAGVGRHHRGGRGRSFGGVSTGSAHGVPDLVRAVRNRVSIVFLSPVFPTLSHPGAAVFGSVRFAAMARFAGCRVFGLGGVDGVSARRLPRWVHGVGAIGALLG